MPRPTPADQRHELNTLTGEALCAAAARIMHDARDLEIVRRAIAILADSEEPRFRPELVTKFTWCEAQPQRRDGGGYIRAAIVKALRPIADHDDAPLFRRAMLTYEMDGPFELCADLRAIGVLAMNEIAPDEAASWAARFLHDGQVTFSGEPARTAIALLASHGNLAPIFGLISWGAARGEVLGEGLRNLVELPESLIPMLVDQHIGSEDEQVLLGLFDLLLGHASRDRWEQTIENWFRTTTIMDLYGIVAFQIVGSRSDALITMLKRLRAEEHDRLRQELLDQALALA